MQKEYEIPIFSGPLQPAHYYGIKVVGVMNDGKFTLAGETIVSAVKGGSGEEKETQPVSVTVGIKPNPKKSKSELIVYVQRDIKLDEELLNVKGLVIITTGTVDGGQFVMPILDTGI
jgi:hypothetical protein